MNSLHLLSPNEQHSFDCSHLLISAILIPMVFGVAHEKHAPFHRVAIKTSGQGTTLLKTKLEPQKWRCLEDEFPFQRGPKRDFSGEGSPSVKLAVKLPLKIDSWKLDHFLQRDATLPEVLTFSHLKKMDAWNFRSFPIGFWPIFPGMLLIFSASRRGVKSQSGRMVDIKVMMPKNLRPNPKQWRPDGRLGWGQKI